MAKQDLSALSLDELQALKKDVEKAIATFRDRQMQAARAELEALAREKGFSLTEIVGTTGKKTRKPSVAKYRHPENPALTWAGRGRQPGWVKEALAQGKSLQDMAI